ncbi:MAG: RNA polymerase sigma factor RpoD, partial [Clostridia bacterium]|nr:RNA polymerase sigma factor RpoD [Clostridia bacterium]
MANEKAFDVKSLIEKGKSKGSLSNNEILEALEEVDLDIEQMEKLYETLESNGIEITGY